MINNTLIIYFNASGGRADLNEHLSINSQTPCRRNKKRGFLFISLWIVTNIFVKKLFCLIKKGIDVPKD